MVVFMLARIILRRTQGTIFIKIDIVLVILIGRTKIDEKLA